MLRRYLIWWHRRRAVYHDAKKHYDYSVMWHAHIIWRDRHLDEIKRLESTDFLKLKTE